MLNIPYELFFKSLNMALTTKFEIAHTNRNFDDTDCSVL